MRLPNIFERVEWGQGWRGANELNYGADMTRTRLHAPHCGHVCVCVYVTGLTLETCVPKPAANASAPKAVVPLSVSCLVCVCVSTTPAVRVADYTHADGACLCVSVRLCVYRLEFNIVIVTMTTDVDAAGVERRSVAHAMNASKLLGRSVECIARLRPLSFD